MDCGGVPGRPFDPSTDSATMHQGHFDQRSEGSVRLVASAPIPPARVLIAARLPDRTASSGTFRITTAHFDNRLFRRNSSPAHCRYRVGLKEVDLSLRQLL